MEGRGLQRSYTQVEFPVTRSARSSHHHYHQSRQGHHGKSEVTAKRNNNNINTANNNMTGARIKPGMELYKPPSSKSSRVVSRRSKSVIIRVRILSMPRKNELESGFVPAVSENREVDFGMVHDYYCSNPLFVSPEIRGSKNARSLNYNLKNVGQNTEVSSMAKEFFKLMTIFTCAKTKAESNSPDQRDPSQLNGTRLNVHAKEFVMAGSPLQGSKSTGNILHAAHDEVSHRKPSIKTITNYPLASSKSGHHQAQQNQMRGVQFSEEQEAVKRGDLKRSKSMSHAHGNQVPVTSELSLFDKHHAASLVKKACFNPDELPSMQLMELAKVLVDKAMDDRAHAQSYASICLTIVEKESSGTFLESLLNISQYTVEKKCYKDGSHRYHAFMAFLNELYSLLKPKQSHLRPHATVSPTLTVLSLIVQVCQSVLSQKNLTQRTEVECLFFTVTTVGRDIEAEEPKLLDSLMWSVRDAFLSPNTSPPIKKTLMQLVELRATKWHLPATAIMYYQSPNP